jgi:hypothetical protein
MRSGELAQGGSRTAAIGWWLAVALAFLPFLFVTIPPLADAPGHLAQVAIQTAPPDSPLRTYFGFHWALKLNLGTDILVEMLRPLFGLERAFWLVAASIPPLTVLAIRCLARTANRGEAGAASWALPFAYPFLFNFGFLNYALASACSFLAFALWIRLCHRALLREALFWLIIPALLIAHAIGGGLLPVMILAAALARLRRDGFGAFVREVRPLVASIPVIALWKLGDTSSGLDTVFSLSSKINAVLLALRDQNRLLDVVSVALILLVPLVGRLLGARYTKTGGAVVIALALLFLAMPNELNGSSYADTRLVPAMIIAALALQNWSAVPRRWATAIALGGFALFAIRIGVTTIGFVAYARSYAVERAALDHVAPGSRVLALVTRQCRASRAWRMDRLDHLPALAVVDRASWTNALWDVPGIHLLEVRFRPSADFYDDPSHYVWPIDCVESEPAPRTAEERRNQRRTIEQTAPMLPLAQVDYLWLINTRLPSGFDASRLASAWSNGHSTLYRVIRPAASAPR